MLEQSVITAVQTYVAAIRQSGIAVDHAVVFGSHASGNNTVNSDIDVVIVSPLFDGIRDRSDINRLWRLAARVDSRIEPIPCGSRQWQEDDSSAIIEIARRQGELLQAA